MYAVVLVGGFGTRLRPLTNDVPKPMLPVGHRPMIVNLVDRLAQCGVTDVVLALGFQPEPFEAAFPDRQHGAVSLHYAVEPEPLDTGGAIAFAARHAGIDDTFLVLNGDNICDVDYAGLVATHRQRGRQATIHLTPVADPSAFGVVETDSDGVVQRFVEKPQPGDTDSNAVSSGAYVFEPEVLDLIEPDRRVSVERETFPALVAEAQLDAVQTDDYWTDTGRPELYLAANLALIDGTRESDVVAVAPGAHVSGARIDNSVVDATAFVGEGATVRDSVLLPGSLVERGATVTRSLVAGTVREGVVVDHVVVGGSAVIEGDLSDARVPDPEK